MIIKTKALVLKEYIVGESDKYVTLFTKDLGKIQVIAPKAKKYDNNLASATQLFVYGEFMLASYKDTYRLLNVEIIYMFHELSMDLHTLSYASYILEFIMEVTQEAPDHEQLLILTLMTFHSLVKNKLSLKLIRRIFEMRALTILGFMPELERCVECAARVKEDPNSLYTFASEAGGIVCKKCHSLYSQKIDISFGTLYTMKYIIHTPLKKLFSFQLDHIILKELEVVCNLYVAFYIGKAFKTLEFIKQIEDLVPY